MTFKYGNRLQQYIISNLGILHKVIESHITKLSGNSYQFRTYNGNEQAFTDEFVNIGLKTVFLITNISDNQYN